MATERPNKPTARERWSPAKILYKHAPSVTPTARRQFVARRCRAAVKKSDLRVMRRGRYFYVRDDWEFEGKTVAELRSGRVKVPPLLASFRRSDAQNDRAQFIREVSPGVWRELREEVASGGGELWLRALFSAMSRPARKGWARRIVAVRDFVLWCDRRKAAGQACSPETFVRFRRGLSHNSVRRWTRLKLLGGWLRLAFDGRGKDLRPRPTQPWILAAYRDFRERLNFTNHAAWRVAAAFAAMAGVKCPSRVSIEVASYRAGGVPL